MREREREIERERERDREREGSCADVHGERRVFSKFVFLLRNRSVDLRHRFFFSFFVGYLQNEEKKKKKQIKRKKTEGKYTCSKQREKFTKRNL